MRLSVQKEELEAEFAAEMEELEADYQKQVDEMYFFGYRCCMKKHGIKRASLRFSQVRRRSYAASLPNENFSFCNFYCYPFPVFCSPENSLYTILTSIQ